ncbi:hypothetical protein [Bradyrhizobium cosmicum]|uniref:hypothetical protein n=1 Tax=Bradyrhizobium cosmicum TaxID=1404864 RepID=UPI0028E6AA3D|nr:hypothetical protein [Bradyrhizobium cosmicum]
MADPNCRSLIKKAATCFCGALTGSEPARATRWKTASGLAAIAEKDKRSGLQKTKHFTVVGNLPREEAVGALGAGITTLRGPPVIRADALCLVAVEEGKSSMSVGYQAADRKRSSLPNGPRDPSSKTECLSACVILVHLS